MRKNRIQNKSWFLHYNRRAPDSQCQIGFVGKSGIANRVQTNRGQFLTFFEILTEIGVMHWCTHTNQVELAKLAGIMQIGGIGFKDPMLLVLVTMHA